MDVFRVAMLVAAVVAMPLSPAKADRQVVGWVENVMIDGEPVMLAAKIDTGAQTSSLHCDCITPANRDGERWVQFDITGIDGKTVRIKRRVERIARIKTHRGEPSERMVVRVGICLANVFREVEVTLVDRSRFEYAMLVGRNFLESHFIVDPGATHLTRPRCDAPR